MMKGDFNNMKVYIVEGHVSYEGDMIVSVHTTRQKAEEKKNYYNSIVELPYSDERRKKFEFSYCDDFTVSEWDVLSEEGIEAGGGGEKGVVSTEN